VTPGGPIQRSTSQRRALVGLAILATGCWLVLAESSRSLENLEGEYIVIDGPEAGAAIDSSPAGYVRPGDSKLNADSRARGSINDPSQRCSSLHFVGSIGDHETRGNACWRVIRRGRASRLLIDLASAIDHENRAIKAEQEHRGNHAASLIASGIISLDDAFDELERAVHRGDIKRGSFTALKEKFENARHLDQRAISRIRDDRLGRFAVEDALEEKHAIVDNLPRRLLTVRPPALKPLEAEFDSTNRQTVYTERATDPDGRHPTYHWTLVEHNDPTCINFEPNKPSENQATWHHADNQGCNHSLEGPRGHVGTITVIVRDGRFECAAFYNGSQGDNGSPSGVGPDPPPCQPFHD
jgi:hypothetical protein